jgi:hypothetical protein
LDTRCEHATLKSRVLTSPSTGPVKPDANVVLIIAYVQMVMTTLLGFAIGLKTNLTTGLISASAMAAFMYMFVWSFKRNKMWAYNMTILLSIIQLPNQLKEFSQAPIATTV